jgi:protease-4
MKIKKFCIFIFIFIAGLAVLSAFMTFLPGDMAAYDKIALVKVEGPIFRSKHIVDEIKEYVKSRSIKAIVLRVDSPGGGVAASQEIYEAVKRAASKKTVVVSMGSTAASGGYYISAPATRIVANPGTLTGSIGVIMEIPNIKGLMEKMGVKSEVIKSGRYKDLASIFKDMGQEERAILQNLMDDVHEQFIQAVSEGRKISLEDVRKIADGRVFSGRQALKLRLVDELGDLEYAIEVAAKIANIKGEPKIIMKKERSPLLDLLQGRFSDLWSKFIPDVELKYLYTP